MDVSLFDFHLPEELIAQTPLKDRTASRLLVLHRETGRIEHRHFFELLTHLHPGDVLVLNDTRVRPARLIGVKEETGARIELLLLNPLGQDRWEALVKPAKRVKEGTVISFADGRLKATALEETQVAGGRVFRLSYNERDLEVVLRELGEMPLPPYIRETLEEKDRYQTVYARETGSAAAPTAGLHFTPQLLAAVKAKGVEVAFLTLHVGLGTFRPVSTETVTEHKMHSEYYRLSEETAALLRKAQGEKRRIIGVGTTTVRTLETIARDRGQLVGASGWTDIFIYPGYEFRVVTGLLTNFHLPKSSLIMLVSAFAGREQTLAAYQSAITEEYRFFSFGDAMLIV